MIASSFDTRLIALPNDGRLQPVSTITQLYASGSNVVIYQGSTFISETCASAEEAAWYYGIIRDFIALRTNQPILYPPIDQGVVAVTSVSPATGAQAGGYFAIIVGTGFMPQATVTFDTVTVTSSWVSPTCLQVIVPAHAAGAVNVRVTNVNGSTAVHNAIFTYV